MNVNNVKNFEKKYISRRGITWHHYFCYHCGKELTKLNLKTGYIMQQQHFLLTTKDGIQVRRCWHGLKCDKRRRSLTNEKN